ncbi:MAG: chemotaxis protein CheD [Chlorobia bacterium]|nr:chemotaxis protein CheD [Fimbriimonadaceae bacterium]
MSAKGSAVRVAMADIQVLRKSGQLTCLGLGSGISLCGFDPVTSVAGMVQIMLPTAFQGKDLEKPGKFADTGVPALIEAMTRVGADQDRILFAMAGGAQIFRFNSAESKLDIGSRNAQATLEAVQAQGLQVVAQDTGGDVARTATFDLESGIFAVRTVTAGEKTLCNLRG